jgi:hypothetical protein
VRELATWNNVAKLAEDLAGRAHADFREAIGRMRADKLGFGDKKPLEIDFLRAAHGETKDVPAAAIADAKAWDKAQGTLADSYIDAGGQLSKREGYFPNPIISEAKARALGEDKFKALVRQVVDRDKVIDFNTNERMGDTKFERLLDAAWRGVDKGREGAPSGDVAGRPMLANSRDAARLFQMKDAENWMHFAESVGEHASPYYAAVDHIHSIAKDTALLRIMGPNPAASLRFMLDILGREPGRLAVRAADLEKGGVAEATRLNQKIAARNGSDQQRLKNLYAEVAGTNRVPVNSEIARRFADTRSLLIGAQLGGTLITALNDPGTMLMTARFNGIPISNVVRWTARMVKERGSEVFAAQQGLIMDTLAQVARAHDSVMGDTIRTGIAAKIGGAVIRASGLRRWTEGIKHGYALGTQAHLATEAAGKDFTELHPAFRASLERYGIGEAEWNVFRAATPSEPRPGAVFLSSMDVAKLGTPAAQAASEKLAQYINSTMNYALLAHPPARLRALMVGDTKAGTVVGELRASMGMYRSWTGGMIYLHGAQMLARGWDGSRLGHAALTFATVTALGAAAMQIKEVLAGRDPKPLDASSEGRHAWLHAMLQGGGLGIFGDLLAVDKTKYGNSWASVFAGPVIGATETGLGQFLLGNVENMMQGKPTHFGGDAAYIMARYTPGSSLWYAKLAFQREVWDQLAKAIDPRTPERFARIESQARQQSNQGYWWRPGQAAPERPPEMTVGR